MAQGYLILHVQRCFILCSKEYLWVLVGYQKMIYLQRITLGMSVASGYSKNESGENKMVRTDITFHTALLSFKAHHRILNGM